MHYVFGEIGVVVRRDRILHGLGVRRFAPN
jgi:hypothetical protein